MKKRSLCLASPPVFSLLAFGIMLGAAGSLALACNVPVFRYALEHWRPDPYRAVLYHRGPVSAADQERLQTLQASVDKLQINMTLRTVDLDASPEPADGQLAATLGDAPLPQLIIQYPVHLQLHQPVWSGPFRDAELTVLLDSPARREILKRLSSGQTAVWLMVDSGDAGKDDPAAALLEREVKGLRTTLKLPELTDSPEDVIQDGPPLRVEFSVLRVRRDDPAEQALVAMLMGCESDLATLNEPMVFPLFGRSRAMLPLVGAGITAENIRGSGEFLTGACSCQVKELNPGFDLLLTADWNDLLSWAQSPAYASGESPASATGEPELVPIPAGSQAETVSPPPDVPAKAANESQQAPVKSTRGGPATLLALGGLAVVIVSVLRRLRW